MSPRRLAAFGQLRLARAVLVPVAIALPPLFWVAHATWRASFSPLGRDQGIFQYVGWALARGDVDYRDVRDVNGPLTHLVHMVFLALGGGDEHRFHVLDLLVTGASFAVAGACLPGLRSARAPSAMERAAWAFAGWVTLSGQYLLFDFWEMAQRESFFDWFLLPAVGLQLVAQAPVRSHRGDGGPRRQATLLAIAGALSAIPWFGKPTYVLFSVLQVAAIALDDGLRAPFLGVRRALRAFAAGALGASLAMLAFLVVYGDAAAFARIQLLDVPAMYRFIWPRSAADMLSESWRATQAFFACAGAVVMLGLIALGELPRRALAVALLPLAALAGVVVQAKGFPYHFHPVTAGVHLQWLAVAAWLAERTRVAERRLALVRALPLAVATLISMRVATALQDSPHLRATWLLWSGRTPPERQTSAYFAHFTRPDFFPLEMRQAAAYLRDHTGPDDRVQTYGMDAYVLFLARRASATPYIYAYDLDVDAALQGGTGGAPNEAQSEGIRAIRDRHEADLLARLKARPPAAFVFMDGVPLLSEADAWSDFEEHCDQAASWVREHYRETARFGHDHVWLRGDVAARDDSANDVTGPPRTQ